LAASFGLFWSGGRADVGSGDFGRSVILWRSGGVDELVGHGGLLRLSRDSMAGQRRCSVRGG